MATYKCWSPSVGQTEEDGKILMHNNAWGAAELYAEDYCNYATTPFTEIDVKVASSDDFYKKVVVFRITVEKILRFTPRCIDNGA